MLHSPSPSSRGNILIVDDDDYIGTTLMRLLERNFDVAVTTRSKQARDWLLRGDRYDVILCDLLMPEVTGMDLHDQLATAAPDQAHRMIFLTGGSLNTSVRDFLDRVPNPRLEKPFELGSLMTLIKARLHQ
ncbi:MAG TPA: response regulator [Nevskiaceae bacterium]|nr:response regulator [Nevskiaceae bacterium]